jgi:hypothetical protein
MDERTIKIDDDDAEGNVKKAISKIVLRRKSHDSNFTNSAQEKKRKEGRNVFMWQYINRNQQNQQHPHRFKRM